MNETPEALIAKLRAMNPGDDWGDKFYAALEALECVMTGRVIAMPYPPHIVMAHFIEDVLYGETRCPVHGHPIEEDTPR